MKTLVVITGATASGKSALAIEVAKSLGTSIISADSRQIYKNIPIGTAVPSKEERAAVPHFFIETLELEDYYSASCFEEDALNVLDEIFKDTDWAVLCGGSMMYIDALVSGLDELPTISAGIREQYQRLYSQKGLGFLLEELRQKDPQYYAQVDKNNYKRIVHALEIIQQSGEKYSALRSNKAKIRPFRVMEFAIDMPREELYERINTRVVRMIEQGWIEEARSVYDRRALNSLNTVGYKELFMMFDGFYAFNEAVEKIKRNTRVYAKKQLTWLKKRSGVHYIDYRLSMNEMVESVLLALNSTDGSYL